MTSTLQEDIARAGEPGTFLGGAAVRDADVKLGALGMADPLGAALWRAKYKGDPHAARQAEALIARRIATDKRWSLKSAPRPRSMRRRGPEAVEECPRPIIERVAFRVLSEWLADRCMVCHGRGTVGEWGAVLKCKHCGGSRREPPQHQVRARDLCVTREVYHQRWEQVFERLLSRLEEVDNEVQGVLIRQCRAATVAPNAETKVAA